MSMKYKLKELLDKYLNYFHRKEIKTNSPLEKKISEEAKTEHGYCYSRLNNTPGAIKKYIK